jgi:hypothetical protein
MSEVLPRPMTSTHYVRSMTRRIRSGATFCSERTLGGQRLCRLESPAWGIPGDSQTTYRRGRPGRPGWCPAAGRTRSQCRRARVSPFALSSGSLARAQRLGQRIAPAVTPTSSSTLQAPPAPKICEGPRTAAGGPIPGAPTRHDRPPFPRAGRTVLCDPASASAGGALGSRSTYFAGTGRG